MRKLNMATQCVRNELGFLDTRGVFHAPHGRRPNPVAAFGLELAQTLRGVFEAPLRQTMETTKTRDLEDLDAATRRDIGL
jgi:hypothetical protein